MVARRWNSALRMYCFLRQVRVWIWPAPQLLHRARDVLTATPQPVQGNVPPPLASRALWNLQYSPRQLFPHTSTVPNSSQAQLFVPFIAMLRYTLVMSTYNRGWPQWTKYCHWAFSHWASSTGSTRPQWVNISCAYDDQDSWCRMASPGLNGLSCANDDQASSRRMAAPGLNGLSCANDDHASWRRMAAPGLNGLTLAVPMISLPGDSVSCLDLVTWDTVYVLVALTWPS